MAPRTITAALLALALAVLPGCSLLRVGYGHFDTFALWNAERYFDLEADQRQEFVKRFARLHDWHRYEQLPDYIAFLGETKTRVQKGITREDVTWVNEGAKARYRTIVRRMTDDAATMLMTVTPAQIDALQRRWDRENRRFIGEYRLDAGIEEQRQARLERVLTRIRHWTGSLTTEQETQIAAMVREQPVIHGLRHDDRMRRQREFLKLMGERKDAPRFAARLGDWLANWEKGRDPEYDRQFRDWESRQAVVYVAVDRMLTPQQRANVISRLQTYIDDFSRLSEPRPPVDAVTQ